MYKLGNTKEIWSKAINEDGFLKEKFLGKTNPNKTQFNSYSIDLEWKAMEKAKSYGLIVENLDASKTFGFPFVHWVCLNINATCIFENESYESYLGWKKNDFTFFPENKLWQGYNSSYNNTLVINNKAPDSQLGGILPPEFTAIDNKESILYFAPSFDDFNHIVTLYLFGFDKSAYELSYYSLLRKSVRKLNKPFLIGDFYRAIYESVVGYYVLNFVCKNKH